MEKSKSWKNFSTTPTASSRLCHNRSEEHKKTIKRINYEGVALYFSSSHRTTPSSSSYLFSSYLFQLIMAVRRSSENTQGNEDLHLPRFHQMKKKENYKKRGYYTTQHTTCSHRLHHHHQHHPCLSLAKSSLTLPSSVVVLLLPQPQLYSNRARG